MKKIDDKHDLDVGVDIINSKLHMKRVKKPHLKLAIKDGEKIEEVEEILVKHIDAED